jgi:fibronectin-binding autotransporter adhesin
MTINNVKVVGTGITTIAGYWHAPVDPATRPYGTLTLTGSATAEFDELRVVDEGGVGIINVNDSATLMVHNLMRVGWSWGDDPVAEVSNGTVNVNGGHVIKDMTGAIRIGDDGGTGVWNQNGGLTETTVPVQLGQSDGSADGTGTLSLNGGTFQAPGIATGNIRAGNAALTLATINFNGGVLKASANSADYIANATGATLTLNVLKNATTGLGAVIDTNTYAVTIDKPLVTGVGSGTDGGLSKLGLGVLTLTGPLSYTGETTLSGGTLQINAANTLSGGVVGSGNLGVGDGATGITLKLTGTENMSGLTTVNAGSVLQILSGGSNTMGAITGAGNLTVANGSSLMTPSISVNTLTIGGTITTVAVPEPSTLVLLVLAGLAFVGAYLRRK